MNSQKDLAMKQLRITRQHYDVLKEHLLKEDKLESVAFILAGHTSYKDTTVLLAHSVHPIPDERCDRGPDYITWKGEDLEPILMDARSKGLRLIKVHSHPNGFSQFSPTDDHSDEALLNSIWGWLPDVNEFGSLVMLPTGDLFGRVHSPGQEAPMPLEKISVVGSSLKFFHDSGPSIVQTSLSRNEQMFGPKTTRMLSQLRVGVVGTSGTGSIIVENLLRLGVGELFLFDPKPVDYKNLNRIIQATTKHAKDRVKKVELMRDYISESGLSTKVSVWDKDICETSDARDALSICDVVFGNTDNVESRVIMDRMSKFHILPYFDTGVGIRSDGQGGIEKINSTSHYIQPFGSSLRTRKLYDWASYEADRLRRINRDEYAHLVNEGYIRGTPTNVDAPAVLPVNMVAASVTISQFLNRLHSFKTVPKDGDSWIIINLSDDYMESQPESSFEEDEELNRNVGLGRIQPELGLLALYRDEAVQSAA